MKFLLIAGRPMFVMSHGEIVFQLLLMSLTLGLLIRHWRKS